MIKRKDVIAENFYMPNNSFVSLCTGLQYSNDIYNDVFYNKEFFSKVILNTYENEIVSLLIMDRSKLSLLHIVIASYVIDIKENFIESIKELPLEIIKKEMDNLQSAVNVTEPDFSLLNEENRIDMISNFFDTNLWNIEDAIISSTFEILFSNRMFLREFNILFSEWLEELNNSEFSKFTNGTNKCKRKTSFPDWIKNAVYFRDKGHCSLCKNKLMPQKEDRDKYDCNEKAEYDHIVPITKGGNNDVSNIQLVCKKCNIEKSNRNSDSSDLHISYFNYPNNYAKAISELASNVK